MGLEAIGSILKRNGLRWFGHVEWKEDCVRKCMLYGVGEWLEVVKNDMKGLLGPCRCSVTCF